MTSSNAFKKRVRAYAAEHNLPYAEARTRLLTDDTPTRTARRFSLHRSDPNDPLRVPYPFHVDEHGLVGWQGFWNGDPWRLIGFEDPKADETRTIAVTLHEFTEHPDAALGLHPVFSDFNNDWATWQSPIEEVTVAEVAPAVNPDDVLATLTLAGVRGLTVEPLTIGVADVLTVLPTSVLDLLADRGWTYTWTPDGEDPDVLLAAHAIGGQRRDLIEAMHADDDDLDGYTLVIDPTAASRWREEQGGRDRTLWRSVTLP